MLDIERTSWYNHQVFLVASSHRANHSQCTARWPYQCASGRPTQCQSTWWGLKLNRFKSWLDYFQNKSVHFWQNQNLKSSFRNAFLCKDTVLSIRSLLLFFGTCSNSHENKNWLTNSFAIESTCNVDHINNNSFDAITLAFDLNEFLIK